MKFYVFSVKGEKLGPSTQEEILGFVNQDLVTAECKMKKTLMPTWQKASDFDFLSAALDAQLDRLVTDKKELERIRESKRKVPKGVDGPSGTSVYEQALTPVKAGPILRFFAFLLDILLVFLFFSAACFAATCVCASKGMYDTVGPKKSEDVKAMIQYRKDAQKRYSNALSEWKKKCDEVRGIAQNNKEDPDKVTLPPEPVKPEEITVKPPVKILHFDAPLDPTVVHDEYLGFRMGMTLTNSETGKTYCCLYTGANHAIWCSQKVVSFWFNLAWILTVCVAFGFNAAMMQLRSQTAGMWFYGIFITDSRDETREVMALRAYAFYLLSIVTCWLTPFFVIATFRSPAEILLRIRMIRVASDK